MKIDPIGELRLTVGQVLFGDTERPVEALFNTLRNREEHDLPDVLIVFLRSHPDAGGFEIVDRREDADHHLLIASLAAPSLIDANVALWYAVGEPEQKHAFAAHVANQYDQIRTGRDPTDWAAIVPIDTVATDQWFDQVQQHGGSLLWTVSVGRIEEGSDVDLFE